MPAWPTIDPRNLNTLWSSVLVETLVRSGVRQAVVSPGSRSAPLAIAAASHPQMEAIPVLDERSAGFFALGLARQRLTPVALICTSGTAAANYLPAVIEARESAVPLIVITADRPPELRGCAAGQAIDQQKIYGDYPTYYHEVATPERSEGMLRYLRQTVAHACARSVTPVPGPVHLNVPLRDPLAPTHDGETQGFSNGIEWGKFFTHVIAPTGSEPMARAPALSASARGLIVVGPSQPRDPAAFAAVVGSIARKLGWPVLADGLSPARNARETIPHLVTTYDAILRDTAIAPQLAPETVLCLGGWPTSKVLRQWLQGQKAAIWLVSNRPDNRDALHGATRQIALSLRALAAALPDDGAAEVNEYRQRWEKFDGPVRGELDKRLETEAALFEPKAAWLMARHLPEQTPLFVASSMPVRDIEYVWPPNGRGARLYFNRGANGIDGTLSTALGVAHGGPPTVLLTGDLALLHDTNGFLIRPKFRGSLTIVLINNRGGGIFQHLPIAQFNPPFEEFFATPQEADFAKLASAYGVEYIPIPDWPTFIDKISSLPPTGIRILELTTNREADARQRQELFNSLSAIIA
ncbi:MAG TPA: 2-succinyl-5-enolpyruvyl-6-hydroxy-3-cyclohexene-1-carboxylic-acid synthase [Opitutaceae bacterium]|jgi:2-succinyl-5-enolpyruvyl-6-hydroxy-3-cyclohexene-1-carboxylate synthase